MPLQWPLVGRHEQLDLFTATLDDHRAHGLVIHGPPGVGKTRLADQCLALADERGHDVARATAAEGLRAVPLGALAHLLPPGIGDERSDLVKVMAEVRPVLQAGRGARRLVMLVDDLHLLDATSATFVGQLLDADLLFLVATVRAGAPVPAGFEATWWRARVQRIDLGDLDRAGVDALLQAVLAGTVEPRTVDDVWAVTKGNPLFVREVVLGALEVGNLRARHGVWRLTGPLSTTRRLQEVIEERLSAVSPEDREVLERLAVWEPTGLDLLETAVGRDRIEQLDRAGLLDVRADGRRHIVSLSHPLYGEILCQHLALLTRRRLQLELADRIEAFGARRRGDPVLAASLRLEACGSADRDLLVRSARLSRYGHDYGAVVRFAGAARMESTDTELDLLLGESLHELGRFAEAEDVLAPATASAAADDPLLVHLVEIRARNLMWGMHEDEGAIAMNAAARQRAASASASIELGLNEALLLTYSGRPLAARRTLDELPAPTDPRTALLRAVSEVPLMIASGRPLAAADAAMRELAASSALVDPVAIPDPGVLVIHQVYALAEAGRLDRATALARQAYDAMPASSAPDGLMWLSFQLGRCALLSGRARLARDWLREALARADAIDNTGPGRLVLSALVTAEVYLGDLAAADAAADELARRPPFSFTRPEQELGRAWRLVGHGDIPGARHVLAETATMAAASGYVCCEAWALHDIVRLGDPAAVADRLAALATEGDSELVFTYAQHATAATAADASALADAADRFEALGTLLLAAEASSELAAILARRGERRSATAAQARSTALLGRCDGARAPWSTGPAVVSPLTARERDIAVLAAHGASSKAIAERLFVSVRTVDNHLQSVYSKLGITGRHQLSGALADQ